jgi:hypothetical protein
LYDAVVSGDHHATTLEMSKADTRKENRMSDEKQSPQEKQPVELTGEELNQVVGGTPDITINKAKTADKSFDKMDDYIRQ